ncbi:type I restriction endonuclease subunit R [Leuconostoc holzapfelii]|uniref:Type I restriction endonuclease subunit R n=1 Tax=Leuconostoc holzapfelii TaxID=434464 RepID=A0ABT2NYE0_9LACO|nr:type I restriction endonuclease subunit R [Leuconostoc holzapfelii]MCT8389610.1 type I restriction endonuclease subunit R [Leuconostoc holzapfelii]
MALEDHLTPEMQALMTRAQTEMKQENWHDAAESLTVIYETIATFDINYRLVTALFMDEQYQLAASYADDFLLNYLEEETDFRMLVALAIQNQNFVYAQQLVMLWQDETVQAAVLSDIRDAEVRAKTTMAATFQTIARQFYHLSDYSIMEQRDRYESARHLPVDEFIVGARYLLVDPFAIPIIRATLLEDLQKLQVAEPVQYRWLDDEIYTIALNQLPLLTDSEIFEEIADYLDEKVGQDDPIALDLLAQQVRFELTLLYPRVTEVVTDPEGWVDASIDQYYERRNLSEMAEQRKWHETVRDLTTSFFEN